MSSYARSESLPPIDSIILATRLTEAISAHPATDSTIQRVQIEMDPGDILAWVNRQAAEEKFYWSNRDGSFEVAGLGHALLLRNETPDEKDIPKVLDACRAVLSEVNPHQRFYGGFSFDKSTEEKWAAFGQYRLVMPQIEVGRDSDAYYAACQWSTETGPPADMQTLLKTDEQNGSRRIARAAQRRVDRPEKYTWMAQIEHLLSLFSQGVVDKVVMARECEFQFDEAIDAMALLSELRRNTGNSYHYGFQVSADTAFIGASPERLYRRDGSTLVSEALAGTRPRGITREQDAAIGQELLNSDKDRREHGLVLERITSLLEEFCESMNPTMEPTITKLRHCQHLLCTIEGTLRNPDCDAELLQQLHPTPAVGGSPREEALRWISNLESFDRGWYAGPIGWISHDSVEFAVAIRSALVHGNSVSAYTGAGIVPGSNPEEEWAEIENKITDFQNLFPLDE
ncbi:MAG: isochorismate synthase [Candidatus Hydrogenedentota bacterium]